MQRDPLLRHDLHLHTTASWDAAAEMTPAAVVARARNAGLEAVGFADHLWLTPKGGSRPSPAYLLRSRTRIPAEPGGPRLLLGVEADCAPAPGMAGASDLKAFDFVIGSYHFADLRYGSVPRPSSPGEFTERLLAGLRSVLEAPRVDIVGHPFHMPWRALEHLPESLRARIPEAVAAALEQTGPLIDLAVERGIALELNARALTNRGRAGLSAFFREALRRGVRFVISSDSHQLAEMDGVRGVADYARDLGIRPSDLWTPPGSA
jgi:histidinol phosphatase-like PHP family hydrolase